MIWKNVRERKGLYMGLTHFDENGKAVMVDVTDKKETAREAVAEGKILVNRDVFQAVKAGTVGKGDVLAVAATAGIAGAKRTSDLIPMCHILPLTNCKVDFRMNEKECAIFCTCTAVPSTVFAPFANAAGSSTSIFLGKLKELNTVTA